MTPIPINLTITDIKFFPSDSPDARDFAMARKSARKAGRKLNSRPHVMFLPCYRDEKMLSGICRFAMENNWVLDTSYYHTGLFPHAWEGDGIICLLHVRGTNPKLTQFIKAHRQCPTVDLSWNDPSVKLPRVLQGNQGIGEAGVKHLASLGCRHLGFVLHKRNHFHLERYEGFKRAADELGLKASLLRAPNNAVSHRDNPDWLTSHMPEDERPFGIMAAADYITQWVNQACAVADLSIPEDVALLGVDNCPEICELAPVALSSIGNNAFQHGYEGAKLLQDLLDGKPAPTEPIRVPPGALYVRQSTSILATRHPHVATAMRYIAEHFADPTLTPKRVATQVPMSERRLHDAFVKHIGRSIYQEIIERRIQCAMHLIKDTKQKLWDISEVSGFGSPEMMSRLFKRQLGHSPSFYRKPS
jgi:LacI family transcriptional regulator